MHDARDNTMYWKGHDAGRESLSTLYAVIAIRDGQVTDLSAWFETEAAAKSWLEASLVELACEAGLDVEDMDADDLRWAIEDDGLDLHVVEMERGR